MNKLSPAQDFIVELAIASQAFLKEAARENKCSIGDLTEDMIREYGRTAAKKK